MSFRGYILTDVLITQNEVLIKIHATAVTASDCVIRGFKMPSNPSFPKKQIMQLLMRIFQVDKCRL